MNFTRENLMKTKEDIIMKQIKKEVLGIFTEEIYKSLRNSQEE